MSLLYHYFAAVRYRTYSYYGWGSGTIHLNYLNCVGDEDGLLDCPRYYDIGVHYCDYSRIAGVYCSSRYNSIL